MSMYLAETLARDRYLERLEQAEQSRIARQVAELRRLDRIRQRAERKLLRVWRRSDELRTTIEALG
jgi:hypothetical protein